MLSAALEEWLVPKAALVAAITGRAPSALARLWLSAIEHELGAAVRDVAWVRVGFGVVGSFEVEGGQRLVSKIARRPRPQLERLLAVREVWRSRGVPSPELVAGPFPVGDAFALLERRFTGGVIPVGPDALAQHFATLVRAGRGTAEPLSALGPSWFSGLAPDRVFPRAPVLAASPPEPGLLAWLEPVARRARALRRPITDDAIVAHFDFRAEHLRAAEDGELACVFDLDSLHRDHLPVALGCAAHAFCAAAPTFDPPSIEAMHAFTERVRRDLALPWSRADAQLAGAAALYASCFSALVEPAERDGFKSTVREQAEELLRVGL